MDSIDSIPTLDAEEEKSLAVKAKDGSIEARNEIVRRHLRYIRKIASRLARYHEQDDLIAEGVFGLLHALERFDPSRGTRLRLYAMRYIRNAMLIYIKRNDPVTGMVWLDDDCRTIDEGLESVHETIADTRSLSPEESAIWAERRRAVQAGLLKLKPHQRRLVASRLSGASLDEIARNRSTKHEGKRRISRQAVCEQSHVAVRRLRHVLAENG